MTDYIDAGLFFIMIAMGGVFTWLGFKRVEGDKLFQLLAFMLFTILALVLVSGFQVQITETIVKQGQLPWDDTVVIIGNHGEWIGWIFFILALTNVVMFILFWRKDKEQERKEREMDFF